MTTPEIAPTPIEAGSLVKLTRDSEAGRGRKGDLVVVGEYISAEEATEGVAFYWGSSHGTGNMNDVTMNATDVELVKTRAQMEGRTIPTRDQIVSMLGLALMDDGEGFEVVETNQDSASGAVECFGKTADGLAFVFTVNVTKLHEVDL